MNLNDITKRLNKLNAAAQDEAPKAKRAKAKPSTTQPSAEIKIAALISKEEQLRETVQRVIAAYGLADKGVSVDVMISRIHEYEKPWQGIVQ